MTDVLGLPRLSASLYEPLWYAAYTRANHEKRVAELLACKSVEHFLPLYESSRQWKDRRVKLQMPLFPGYVFVRMALRDRLQVLQIPGVASLVGCRGLPVALPQEEIASLRAGLTAGIPAEPHAYLSVGRRVRIKAGPLAGMVGVLVRKRNRDRFVISLDLILRSVSVEVDALGLEPCAAGRPATGRRAARV
jgi:transcription antitermination factor NusG